LLRSWSLDIYNGDVYVYLGYIDDDEYEQLSKSIEETGRLLTAYCNGIINNNAIK